MTGLQQQFLFLLYQSPKLGSWPRFHESSCPSPVRCQLGENLQRSIMSVSDVLTGHVVKGPIRISVGKLAYGNILIACNSMMINYCLSKRGRQSDGRVALRSPKGIA